MRACLADPQSYRPGMAAWRVVWQRYPGTGGTREIIVHTVAELRRAREIALADPHTVAVRYYRRYDDRPRVDDACPRGHPLPRAQVHTQWCRCGLVHVRTGLCSTCRNSEPVWEPAFGRGCGPLPADPQRTSHGVPP